MDLIDPLIEKARAMGAELSAHDPLVDKHGPVAAPAACASPPVCVAEEQALFRESLRALEAGRLGDAAAILQRLADSGSANHQVYDLLGTLRHESGDVAGAAQMFRIAAGLEFDGTSALRKLIVAYTQLGEIAQALAASHLVLKKEPDDPDIPAFLRDLVAASDLRFDDPTALGSAIRAAFVERDELRRLTPLIRRSASFCENLARDLAGLRQTIGQRTPKRERKPTWTPPPRTYTGAVEHKSVILFLPYASGSIAVRRILARLTAGDYAFHDVDVINWFRDIEEDVRESMEERAYLIERCGGIYTFFDTRSLQASLAKSRLALADLKTIIAIRDPRDALVSLFHLVQDEEHNQYAQGNRNLAEFVQAEADRVRKLSVDEYVLENAPHWTENLASLFKLVDESPDGEHVLLSYALLCHDFPTYLERLIAVLELSPGSELVDELLKTEDVRNSATLHAQSLARSRNASPQPGRHQRELKAATIETLNGITKSIRTWLSMHDDEGLRTLYGD